MKDFRKSYVEKLNLKFLIKEASLVQREVDFAWQKTEGLLQKDTKMSNNNPSVSFADSSLCTREPIKKLTSQAIKRPNSGVFA